MDKIGYSTLFFLHVISFVAIAAPIMTHIVIEMVGSRVSSTTLAGMYHVGNVTGQFATFGGAGALITGLIMVAIASGNPDMGWNKLWIWTSVVLFVAAAGIGSAILGPGGQTIETQLAAGNQPDPQVVARNNTFSYITIVLWLAIVFLMVFKPF
ncbi:MAG: hypothetical protein DLM69_05415 [Candidatus Chloroheliales bacterium]|nr:MAG: hypothetical protein DLM69_05415 [Chloroflexota bacterium]